MVLPPLPTTVNPVHATPVEHVTLEVATFEMPFDAEPYNKLPAVNEVCPVPPLATDNAVPNDNALTVKLVIVLDAALTNRLPERVRVVPVALKFETVKLVIVLVATFAIKLPVMASEVVVAFVTVNAALVKEPPMYALPVLVINPAFVMPERVDVAVAPSVFAESPP